VCAFKSTLSLRVFNGGRNVSKLFKVGGRCNRRRGGRSPRASIPAVASFDHIACPGRIAVPLHLPRACRSAQRPPRNGCAHYQQEGRHRRGSQPRRIQTSRASGRARMMTMMTRLGAPGRHSIIAAIAGSRRRCSWLQERITKRWAGWMPHSTCLRRAISCAVAAGESPPYRCRRSFTRRTCGRRTTRSRHGGCNGRCHASACTHRHSR